MSDIGLDKQNFEPKNVNIFLPISLAYMFGSSKEPFHGLSTHTICFG